MTRPMRTRSQYFSASAAASASVSESAAMAAPEPPVVRTSARKHRGAGGAKVKIEYELDQDQEPLLPQPPAPASSSATSVKTEPASATTDDPSESEQPTVPSDPRPTPPTRSARKPRASPTLHPPPTNWLETYTRIDTWRATGPVAPVDTAGCTSLAQGDPNSPLYRFHTLVALMLSSQTKDEITATAMRNLQAMDLTVDNVLAWPDERISAAIGKVGFWRRKTEYIKKTARVLRDKYGGDIPKTIDELMALPGVGPKMGYLALQVAWGINDGIGVDVHVHRISNRLGWVKSSTPEETRKALESWLPRDKWPAINPMLVGFGQVQCLPLRPMCGACPIANVCPSNELALPKQEQAGGAKRKAGAAASASSARKRRRKRDEDTSSEEEAEVQETSESDAGSMVGDSSESDSELSSIGGGDSDSD